MGRKMALYEILRALVYRIRAVFDSLRSGGIFVESLRSKDGADFGWDLWNFVRGVGISDASGNGLGVDGGAGVHRVFGGRFHLARNGRLDGLFGGRAKIVCSLVDLADACRLNGFDRDTVEEPRLKQSRNSSPAQAKRTLRLCGIPKRRLPTS